MSAKATLARTAIAGFIGAIVLGACAVSTMNPVPTSEAIADLAPAAKLRAAINFGNPILAIQDSRSGEVRGVSVDLARELARRLGVPMELVTFPAAGKVVEA